MKIQVLFSAMYQTDLSLPTRSRVAESDCIVINQTSLDQYPSLNQVTPNVCFVSTEERGLSRSRNMALSLATGDICLLADDDLVYYEDYRCTVQEAYNCFPDADIILFDFDEPRGTHRNRRKPKSSSGRLNYLELLRGNSVRISFRRQRIQELNVRFNEFFGAGSGVFTMGEDALILADAYRRGARIYYYDRKILRLLPDKFLRGSSWFRGYDEQYYYNVGGFSAFYTPRFAWLYILQFILRHYRQGELSLRKKVRGAYYGFRTARYLRESGGNDPL